jgi:hypothetical protein
MDACCKCGPEATAEALGIGSVQDRGLCWGERVSSGNHSGGPLSLPPSLSLSPLLELLCEKYEYAHRSLDSSAIKSLDYFMKKKTDQFNNSMNRYVSDSRVM